MIKLKIRRANPFWRFGKIQLTQQSPFSPEIDASKLTAVQKKILRNSIEQNQVFLVMGSVEELGIEEKVKEEPIVQVSTEGTEFVVVGDDEVIVPEVSVATVPLEDEDFIEDDNVIVDDKEEERKALINQASELIEKSASVVKDAIAATEDVEFLNICLEIEEADKNRSTVVKAIKEKLEG